MNLWMFEMAAEWPAFVRATLEPGLAWRRTMLESYRLLLTAAGENRPPTTRALAAVVPGSGGHRVRITTENSAEPRTSMYAAMDDEELAEAVAFHEGYAAHHTAWQDLYIAGRDAQALPSQTPARVPSTTTNLVWSQDLPTVGESAATTRTFHYEDVAQFASLSGDRNPLHLDPEAWMGTPFTGNLVHGVLTASLFSQLMGMELPGPGAVYLSQTLKFQAPVYIGETVSARVTVTHVRTDKRIVTLETHAEVTRDGLPVAVLEGEAVVKVMKRAPQDDIAAGSA